VRCYTVSVKLQLIDTSPDDAAGRIEQALVAIGAADRAAEPVTVSSPLDGRPGTSTAYLVLRAEDRTELEAIVTAVLKTVQGARVLPLQPMTLLAVRDAS